ncbi:DUF4250 domain-containing protein [Clostridium frigidicarnis]|uniref:DUF4250 domain-containing protein n=1 Tax=Clostridium frigidicarnis TaxID=84698 RepID=A0A1I0XHM2_9CLOT|nr:DUF4250 domain-containing protein [Clostridium frigidicarnis]SFB00599.1 protein of unknown function [Clostridium frigidicarnis]
MDRDRLLEMDPYVLLSLINMKLRDEFTSLRDFCTFNDINSECIIKKLMKLGYVYDELLNQFKVA